MTRVEIQDDRLIAHIQGVDKVLALKSELTIPLAHVKGASVSPPDVRRRWGSLLRAHVPGTDLPYVVMAGTFGSSTESMRSGTCTIPIGPSSSSWTTNDSPTSCLRWRIRRRRPPPSMPRSPAFQEQGRNHHDGKPGKPERVAPEDVGEPVDAEVEA